MQCVLTTITWGIDLGMHYVTYRAGCFRDGDDNTIDRVPRWAALSQFCMYGNNEDDDDDTVYADVIMTCVNRLTNAEQRQAMPSVQVSRLGSWFSVVIL